MLDEGDVFSVEWDERPFRVIMRDPIETFYDVLWPDLGWGLARARTATYYRISTKFLEHRARYLRSEPLSQKELAKHRPDLPFRFFRSRHFSWFDDRTKLISLAAGDQVNAERLRIIPFGAKGGRQKAITVDSKRDHTIRLQDLVVEACGAQNAKCDDVKGVGIYRSGLVGGDPSYYLWGAIDQANNADEIE